MTYDAALANLKSCFLGLSERALVVNLLRALELGRNVRMLDIGSGDCSYVKKIAAELDAPELSLTCLDPNIKVSSAESRQDNFIYVKGDFENFHPQQRFDVILSTQSLYYVGHLQDAMERVAELLRPGGHFLATLWSRRCAMYQMSQKIFRGSLGSSITSEDLYANLAALSSFRNPRMQYYRGVVDWERIASSDRLLRDFLAICSRKMNPSISNEVLKASKALRMPDRFVRVNGVILTTRCNI